MSRVLPGLAQHLAQLGLGVYSTSVPYRDDEWGIALGAMPAHPQRAIALTAYQGPVSNSGEPYDHAYIQVRVRALDVLESLDRVVGIYEALQGTGVVDLPDGTRVVNIVALTSPVTIGQDANNRHEHTVNVHVEHRRGAP